MDLVRRDLARFVENRVPQRIPGGRAEAGNNAAGYCCEHPGIVLFSRFAK